MLDITINQIKIGSEEITKMTYEDAVKYFFGLMNDNFYYGINDNIFELFYDEVIK